MVLFDRVTDGQTLSDGDHTVADSDGPISGEAENGAYYPVSLPKFVILSVLTFGLFEFYWLYKNWVFIKERDHSHIRPLARAFFGVLFLYSLIEDVAARRKVALGSVILTASFFVLHTAWRWPEQWWLVSLLTSLPLIPVLRQINALNRPNSERYAVNSAWRPRHVVLAAVLGPFLALVVASEFMLVPNTRVVDGEWVWGPSRAFLESNNLLAPGEEVVLFYSAGLLSFAEDGNLLTDRRVVSYETDPASGALLVAQSDLPDVVGIAVEPGKWLTPTMVVVIREDRACFALRLSAEGGGDRRFIRALEARTRVSAAPAEATALETQCGAPASPLAAVTDPASFVVRHG